jgi:two-component system, sensor histidine kinase PdtaS
VALGGIAATVTSAAGLPDTGSTYILLYPVVFLCSYFGGRDCGVPAAGAGASVFFVQLVRSWSQNPFRLQHLASLLLFTAIAIGTAVLLSKLRKARIRADEARAAAIRSRDEAQQAHHETDLLLRELRHRVQNDVANFVAILRLQARNAEPAAAAQLKSAAERLQVLARVHEKLSRKGHNPVVDLRDFLEQLCSDLQTTLLGVRPIALTCDADTAKVSSSEAVAVGIIVNELLTNAVKYAFPDDEAGRISVSARSVDRSILEVKVADDGIGFEDSPSASGLGQKLIRGLVGQLGGSYECVTNGAGTRSVLRFPMRPRSGELSESLNCYE